MVVRCTIDRITFRQKTADCREIARARGGGEGRMRRRHAVTLNLIDAAHEICPTARTVFACQPALRHGQRDRLIVDQALRLLAEMFLGGAGGQFAGRAGHDTSFPLCARCPLTGRKGRMTVDGNQGWAAPFPRTGGRLVGLKTMMDLSARQCKSVGQVVMRHRSTLRCHQSFVDPRGGGFGGPCSMKRGTISTLWPYDLLVHWQFREPWPDPNSSNSLCGSQCR